MLQSKSSGSAPAHNLRGVLAMIAAMASFVAGDTIVKHVGQDLPLGQIILVRGLFASAFVLVMAQATGALRYWRQTLTVPILLRSLAEIGATFCFFSALTRMPFADVNAIGQFTPMAITASAALFLGEPVGWRRWLATLAGLIGVLIIVRPGTTAFDSAALLAAGSVLFITARDLITRRLGHALPTLAITSVSILCVAASGLVLAPFETWRLPSADQTALLACAGVTIIGGYYWIIMAMRTGEIALVSPFRYTATLFAVVSGFVIFNEFPDPITIAGIVIVVLAGLYTLQRERIRRQPPSGAAAQEPRTKTITRSAREPPRGSDRE